MSGGQNSGIKKGIQTGVDKRVPLNRGLCKIETKVRSGEKAFPAEHGHTSPGLGDKAENVEIENGVKTEKRVKSKPISSTDANAHTIGYISGARSSETNDTGTSTTNVNQNPKNTQQKKAHTQNQKATIDFNKNCEISVTDGPSKEPELVTDLEKNLNLGQPPDCFREPSKRLSWLNRRQSNANIKKIASLRKHGNLTTRSGKFKNTRDLSTSVFEALQRIKHDETIAKLRLQNEKCTRKRYADERQREEFDGREEINDESMSRLTGLFVHIAETARIREIQKNRKKEGNRVDKSSSDASGEYPYATENKNSGYDQATGPKKSLPLFNPLLVSCLKSEPQ